MKHFYQKVKEALIPKESKSFWQGKRQLLKWWRWRQPDVGADCIVEYSGLIPTISLL